jgi:DNA polymerase-3 subunit gamma/tau
MLGLADRARVIDLFEAVMRGDVAGALKELHDQYDSGADPAVMLSDLAEFTHFVTRIKAVPAVAEDVSISEVERTRGRDFAAKLSMRVLSRTWQMLMKGLTEVQAAGRPISAAEMVLVRIAYAADLPTPDDVIRSLGDDSGNGASPRASTNGGGGAGVSAQAGGFAPRFDAPRSAPRATSAAAAPVARMAEPAPDANALTIGRFEDLVALAAEKRDLQAKVALERDIRLVRCEDGHLEIALEPSAPKTLVHELQRKISTWTGKRWMVVVSKEAGAPTIRAQAEAADAALKVGVRADPLVQAVLEKFPGAEIVAVRNREDAPREEFPDAPPMDENED